MSDYVCGCTGTIMKRKIVVKNVHVGYDTLYMKCELSI